jgi:hypothetical protein
VPLIGPILVGIAVTAILILIYIGTVLQTTSDAKLQDQPKN